MVGICPNHKGRVYHFPHTHKKQKQKNNQNLKSKKQIDKTKKNGEKCHNCSHFDLIDAYFTKFCLPNLFMEWTLQYIFSCNSYKCVLLNYGLDLRLGHIN